MQISRPRDEDSAGLGGTSQIREKARSPQKASSMDTRVYTPLIFKAVSEFDLILGNLWRAASHDRG
jgi:hypothetical protein